MIYEQNTQKWKLGDVVIHGADAKKAEMLMRVTGTTRDGKVSTRYLDRSVCPDRYQNDMAVLHDPARFGIVTPNAAVKPRRSED